MKTLAAVACLLLSSVASAVFAQEPATLAPGLRVRLSRGTGGLVEGRIQSSDDDVLNVIGRDRALVRVPRAEVTKLEVGLGRKSHVRKGILIGSAIGLAAGLAIERAVRSEEDCGCESTGLAAMVLTASGAWTGAAVGWFVRPNRWTEIPLDRVRVGVAAGDRRGIGLRIAVAFLGCPEQSRRG